VQSCRGHITRQRGRSRSFVQANDMPKRNLERDPREIRFTDGSNDEWRVLAREDHGSGGAGREGLRARDRGRGAEGEDLEDKGKKETGLRHWSRHSRARDLSAGECPWRIASKLAALAARIGRHSHESTSRHPGRRVPPECRCHRYTGCATTRGRSRDLGYPVSARPVTRGIRQKRRKKSQKNALQCKPDPCEIRDPPTVPPTTTADRIFRAIRAPRRNGSRLSQRGRPALCAVGRFINLSD